MLPFTRQNIQMTYILYINLGKNRIEGSTLNLSLTSRKSRQTSSIKTIEGYYSMPAQPHTALYMVKEISMDI